MVGGDEAIGAVKVKQKCMSGISNSNFETSLRELKIVKVRRISSQICKISSPAHISRPPETREYIVDCTLKLVFDLLRRCRTYL